MDIDATIPEDWTRIETVDAHTGGEPLRLITGGFPALAGDSILEKRRYLREHHDDLRTALLWEPRGHTDMYGAVLTEPETEDGDFGVLFLTNEGYSSMCGHGIIALGEMLIEADVIDADPPEEIIRFDTPAGRVTARASVADGRVESVAFENVPSFVAELDGRVDVPDLGTVEFDLAYGGAFYAYVDADQVDLQLTPENAGEISRVGMQIKRAVAESTAIEHPFEDDLSFLYGTIFRGPSEEPDCDSRNVCVFADGQIDRSPTGTGVSGRLAINHARGKLGVGEAVVVESVIGTQFVGRIVESTTYGDDDAVVPEIRGTAHIVGRNEFVIDPEDPLRDGFFLQ